MTEPVLASTALGPGPSARCSPARPHFTRQAPTPAPLYDASYRFADRSKASTPSSRQALDSPTSQEMIKKRRRRACPSCVRCHRLKVKCDKKQPCTRCRLSGRGKHCTYTHRIEAEATASAASEGGSPLAMADEELAAVVATWYSRHGGPSQRALLSRVSFRGRDAASCGWAANAQPEQPNTLCGIGHSIFLAASRDVAQGHDECAAGRALPGDPTVELCMAAEACLGKTPFMLRPNISTMRTLWLVVLAKQVVNGTCWSFDSCWCLLGVVVRLAVCLGIHRPRPPPASLPVVFRDWESGQVLWTTVLYLNVQMAMTTRIPSCLSSEEMLQDYGTQSRSFATLDTPTSTWHAVIHTSCPTILRVISRASSDVDKPSYEEILGTARVRELESVLDRVHGHNTTLRIALDVFFRRVILVLHRRHALEPDAPSRYPVSY
ncbi:Uncharacterized protein TCAP_03409 [Tolypocladium capitatum]|uniref:Zn(2)-C6 fungal-type domain-containing protein n=1 Tax=Tolypocladium capitatum TaxID=45235 RepID=A0A2K3QGN6_9HYPO|nr:Uncharacterized protein TCAP_03409 [Tolypocladium capitatum]